MTTNDHPITPPPPELVGEWLCNDGYPWDPSENVTVTITNNRLRNVATQAARWGADTELEACCEQLRSLGPGPQTIDRLRAARRPKALTLKELCFMHLSVMERDGHYIPEILGDLRRALEALTE